MAQAAGSFRDFEHQGWSAQAIASGYHQYLSGVTTQAIDALLDAAAVKRGTRLADVATGAGYVAAAAAGRGAEVIGLDFSATQIALARQHYPAIDFREADAAALPFDDDSLDAVVSNFGMPHFPDPDAFLRESWRVLRSGGRIAFTAWAPPSESVGFGIVYSAVQAHGRTDVALPPGPDFFKFSHAEQCVQSLEAAGFRSVSVTKAAQVWRVESPDVPFEAIMKGTVRAAALLGAQTPESLEAIRDSMRRAVAACARDGTIELAMPAVVSSGEKP